MTLHKSKTHLTSFHFFLLTAVLLFGLSGCTPKKQSPQVVNGVIDLSSWDFDHNGPVLLFGDWKFHWNEQSEIKSSNIEDGKKDLFHVPGVWQGQTAKGRTLSPTGSAVYRLRLLMPNDHPEKVAVLVAGGMSVCEIWINGTKLAESGTFGTSSESEKPMRHYVIAECPESWRLMEITLRVSNHHNIQGGLNSTVLLGTSQQILNFYTVPRLIGAGMAGALFCLSLMHIVLFYMRRSGKEYLYFGLFCLFWCVAILFSPSSGFLMTLLMPIIPWDWYISFSMIPYGATIPLMLMFYHRLFPKRYGPIIERVYWAAGLSFVTYILLTPSNAYDAVLILYFLINVIALIYMCFCFAIDLIHREIGTGILVVGYFALVFAELDDLLFDLNILNSASLRPLGVFIFII